MTTLTYPDGQQVEYRYNAAGELAEVKDWKGRLTRYRYDASGKLIETKRPNGSREERSYDAAGRLERLTDNDRHGIRLQQHNYLYNKSGLLIQEEEKQYTYDGLRRLTNGSWPGRRIQYAYDLAGNITEIADNKVHTAAESLHYTSDNRIQWLGEFPVEMDADGNLLYMTDGESMSAYEYDARNRLIQTGKHRYRYNAQGHRIEQLIRGKSTRYVLDESQELSRVLMEIDHNGEVKARYVYGLGLIGREDANGQYLSYHSDMRGSTTLLSNEHGKVTDRYTYGIYGEFESHEGSTHQPFCYNGRDGVMTDSNGLYYMRARYYDPKIKRFINRDVIRGDVLDGQTFNRYVYVNGNPVSFIDPLGLEKGKFGGDKTEGTGNIQTGGRNNLSVDEYFRQEAEASKMYDSIRASTSDVQGISKNTGIAESRIQRIKDHVFNNEHIKSSGNGRFDPDYEIAQAWTRLQQGTYNTKDIDLLNHELFESRFEGIFKTNYETAHDAAVRSGRPWEIGD